MGCRAPPPCCTPVLWWSHPIRKTVCGMQRNDGSETHNALAPPQIEPAESSHPAACARAPRQPDNTDSQTRPISCLAWCSSARPRPPSAHPTLQCPLVHLVHQHVADGQQRGVARQAPQQDACGAEQQACVAGGGRVQPHMVAHLQNKKEGDRGGAVGRWLTRLAARDSAKTGLQLSAVHAVCVDRNVNGTLNKTAALLLCRTWPTR